MDLMPSHNKEAKVFSDQIADNQYVELNDSDVEIFVFRTNCKYHRNKRFDAFTQ